MTPEERRERRERRREARRREWEQERQDRETAKQAMRSILADSQATPQQRLDALKILDHLTYSDMVPTSVSMRDEEADKDLISKFKTELKKFQSRNSPDK